MEASKSEAGKKNWEQDSLEIGVQKGTKQQWYYKQKLAA